VSSSENAPNQKRGRLIFLTIVGIYAVTLSVAWIWSQNTDRFEITETTNKGTLIEPPRPISLDDSIELEGFAAEDTLRRIWTLIYVTDNRCDTVCLDRLYKLRQTRLALGPQRMDRVQGLFLHNGEFAAETQAVLEADHNGLMIHQLADTNRIRNALTELYGEGFETLGHIYLVDPFGNLMMQYDGDTSPYAIKKDLKHLLKVSRAG
jgi:hypothetical protein